MGTSQSALQIPVDEGIFSETTGYTLADAVATDSVLKRYGFLESVLQFGGSGRLVKTFSLRRTNNASHDGPPVTAILKAVWILEQDEVNQSTATTATGGANSNAPRPRVRPTSWLQEYVHELERLRRVLAPLPHVAPYTVWFSGDVRPLPRPLHNRQRLASLTATTTKYYGTPQSAPSAPFSQSPVTVRPVYLLRPAVYTTLSDRLTSRPWLTLVEKLWVARQILQAVQSLHDHNVVHGSLSTDNIGLTSHGWVVLLDVTAQRIQARTALPDNDPSDYLYFFQPVRLSQNHAHAETSGPTSVPSNRPHRETKCYLAPERFVTPTDTNSNTNTNTAIPEPPVTPAMDIFAVGCILVEVFLNGERCFDLGEVMDYRRLDATLLHQKLSKIESSAMRAACKHMLAVDPTLRRSASAYDERLRAADQFPDSFYYLTQLAQDVVTGQPATCTNENAATINDTAVDPVWAAASIVTPDARLAVWAKAYGRVVWDTMGVRDTPSDAYFATVLGPTLALNASTDDAVPVEPAPVSSLDDLLAKVKALLNDLDADVSDGVEPAPVPAPILDTTTEHETVERSLLCQSSLLIYLQFILSTIRHVLKPESKLVALQLIGRLSRFSSDESRLQRIVPVTVSLLSDPEPLVRAAALSVVTSTLAMIETFPPSDSKLFPQYIFKRVSHMMTDPALVVRLAFAQYMAILAETSLRFLDISHAVRLYEAVGNGASGTTSRDEMMRGGVDRNVAVFGDEVTKLLDTESKVASRVNLNTAHTEGSVESSSGQSEAVSAAATGKILIHSTYNGELTGLHDTVSRWVVHIMTDQSEHAALVKRTLLGDMSRLCGFFGLEGVMAFILPQILAFLNERKDWELRTTLFEHLPAACHSIGRAATEEFVLPCVEIGLVDNEEQVVCRALSCLARTASMGLLSRTAVVGSGMSSSPCLLAKYGALLLYPSADVRHCAIDAFSHICRKLGRPDCDVYAVPLLQPYFRFRLGSEALLAPDGVWKWLKPAWTRERVASVLQELVIAERNALWSSGAWTSIGATASESKGGSQPIEKGPLDDDAIQSDPEEVGMRDYLIMRARHSKQSFGLEPSSHEKSVAGQLSQCIEGSAKLAQSVMFPRQSSRSTKKFLPEWYSSLRDKAANSNYQVSEATSIRSISMLGHVYGLTIMGPTEGTMVNIVGAADESHGIEEISQKILDSTEAKITQGFFNGEWGSDAVLEPDLVDTCLLVSKLKALRVPPLPLDLGDPVTKQLGSGSSVKDSHEWKPRLKNLLATSSSGSGHDAPVVRLAVSIDQSFFASASHDGACRVWDIPQIEDSAGRLESSATYNQHSTDGPTKINDVAMIEGTYSVVSGDSNGSVHVWRVDMVTSSVPPSQTDTSRSHDRPRTAGFTSIRTAEPQEGEILSVSHFNSTSASLVTFATQKGVIHSWDLRSPDEPFKLKHSSEIGYLTSMALGSDRYWMTTGTSKGYVALWDIRFQQCVKLWQHSRRAPISRLATSTVAPPQQWGGTNAAGIRPFVFVATGSNECSMFDVQTGDCAECFRTVVGDSRNLNVHVEDPPSFLEIPCSSKLTKPINMSASVAHVVPVAPINCMVGSIGATDQSYLVTGGGDGRIRFWDFTSPSKCFLLSDQSQSQPRPSFERIDFAGPCRLMLCRQSLSYGLRDVGSKKMTLGLKRPEHFHSDSIEDIKVLSNSGIISCSRDCTVKVWR